MVNYPSLLKFPDRAFWLRATFTLAVLLALLNALEGTVADPDLWGYLAFGRLFWETPVFPYHDVFSYVPTIDPWVYHEWLTGVIFYPLYRALGGTGLQFLKYGLALATLGFIYLAARTRGADPVSAALGLWLAQFFLAIGYSPVRAQVFTYLFFAVSLYLLEKARLSGRWRGLGIIVLIMIPWSNLHGGFVAGLGLMGLYAGGEALSRRPFWPYLTALALAGLATLINPYGLEYWTYLLRAISMARPEIGEWASVFQAFRSGQSLELLVHFFLLVIFSFFLMAWARWREITPGLVLGLTLYLGLKHQRHLIFFYLSLAAYLPVLIRAYAEELKSRPGLLARVRRLCWALPLVLALLAGINGYRLLSRGPLSFRIPAYPTTVDSSRAIYYPVAAINFIQKNRLSGSLLTEFRWGEYLLWVLYPQCRVALDGRYETVYPDEVSQEYWDFIQGRSNWRQFLEQYPPDLILIKPSAKVFPLLAQEGHWRQIYADNGSVLFKRQDKVAVDRPSAQED